MNADQLRIELTQEQQDQSTAALASEISSLELNARELEQRIAPAVIQATLSSMVSEVIKNFGQALQSAARA